MQALANGALIGAGTAVLMLYGNVFLGLWLLGIGIAAFIQQVNK